MASELHPAIWDGPFPAQLPNGQLVHRGDEAMVTDGDLLSSHWKAVKAPKPAPAPAPEHDGKAAA